jgi:hypothetical protein
MTRTNSALISVLAIVVMAFAAAPAMASDGYSSVTALTGDPGSQQSNSTGNYNTVSALTGDQASNQSVQPHQQSAQPQGHSSVTALTGDRSPQPVSSPSINTQDNGGFDWGDALIGALVASGLLGLAFVAASSVARHRRAAAEPRV